MLKTPEEYSPENTLICRQFTIFRTLLKSITRPLQGGGRWFEPSIAHFEIATLRRQNAAQERSGKRIPAPILQFASLEAPSIGA